MKKTIILLSLCILVCGCENSSELEYLRLVNGTGAAEYFGSWVSIFKDYLFWPYAIIFGILLLGHGNGLPWVFHIIISVAFFISFHWDLDPLRAILIPYYICMPMLYIPFIKKDWILYTFIAGSFAAFLYLCYKAWCYEGFFTWIFHMAIWGACGYGGVIAFVMQLEGRCPHCGYYALSWRGRTKRYDEAIDHFRYLNTDGSDLKNMVEDGEDNLGKERCGHCSQLIDV